MKAPLALVILLMFASITVASAWDGGKRHRSEIADYSARVYVKTTSGYRIGQATYLSHRLWITTGNLVEGDASDIWIAGHDAELAFAPMREERQEHDWVILCTPGFTPAGTSSRQVDLKGCMPCKGDAAFYIVDLNRWDTLLRVEFIDEDEASWYIPCGLFGEEGTFCLTLAADDNMQGAGVFNTCGRLIGLLTSQRMRCFQSEGTYYAIPLDADDPVSYDASDRGGISYVQVTSALVPEWDEVLEVLGELGADERYQSFWDE